MRKIQLFVGSNLDGVQNTAQKETREAPDIDHCKPHNPESTQHGVLNADKRLGLVNADGVNGLRSAHRDGADGGSQNHVPAARQTDFVQEADTIRARQQKSPGDRNVDTAGREVGEEGAADRLGKACEHCSDHQSEAAVYGAQGSKSSSKHGYDGMNGTTQYAHGERNQDDGMTENVMNGTRTHIRGTAQSNTHYGRGGAQGEDSPQRSRSNVRPNNSSSHANIHSDVASGNNENESVRQLLEGDSGRKGSIIGSRHVASEDGGNHDDAAIAGMLEAQHILDSLRACTTDAQTSSTAPNSHRRGDRHNIHEDDANARPIGDALNATLANRATTEPLESAQASSSHATSSPSSLPATRSSDAGGAPRGRLSGSHTPNSTRCLSLSAASTALSATARCISAGDDALDSECDAPQDTIDGYGTSQDHGKVSGALPGSMAWEKKHVVCSEDDVAVNNGNHNSGGMSSGYGSNAIPSAHISHAQQVDMQKMRGGHKHTLQMSEKHRTSPVGTDCRGSISSMSDSSMLERGEGKGTPGGGVACNQTSSQRSRASAGTGRPSSSPDGSTRPNECDGDHTADVNTQLNFSPVAKKLSSVTAMSPTSSQAYGNSSSKTNMGESDNPPQKTPKTKQDYMHVNNSMTATAGSESWSGPSGGLSPGSMFGQGGAFAPVSPKRNPPEVSRHVKSSGMPPGDHTDVDTLGRACTYMEASSSAQSDGMEALQATRKATTAGQNSPGTHVSTSALTSVLHSNNAQEQSPSWKKMGAVEKAKVSERINKLEQSVLAMHMDEDIRAALGYASTAGATAATGSGKADAASMWGWCLINGSKTKV
jgi:hypothetical protein